MNLLTECKKQFKHYIGFCESKINGNWAAIIRKFPSKTYLSERDKWDNETITKFEKDCAKGNYHAVGKYFDVLGWWHHHQNDYPRMYPSALLWLSKPTTNAFQECVFSLGSWFDSNRLMRQQTAHTFQVRMLECITQQLRRYITEAKTTIGIAARQQQGRTKKVPNPRPWININHEEVQEMTTKVIHQRQSLIQVQELYKKNSGQKTAPNVQAELELSFWFVKEVTDSGELLAAVPDMVYDNLDTADDVAVNPHVVAKTDSEEVNEDVTVDTTEEELLENDYELLRSLQDDILTLKVEASQEGERYLEQKEMEKVRQLSKQEHDTKKPASQPAKRKVFGDDDDSINASDHHTENNDPNDEKEHDNNEQNDKDDLDDVADVKLPARRSPRQRMPWTPSTRSSSNKKTKHA